MENSKTPQETKSKEKLKKGLKKVGSTLKKGAKKALPIAVGWLAGTFFPPAGIALYQVIKDGLNKTSVELPIEDGKLKEFCDKAVGEKSIEYLQDALRKALSESDILTEDQLEMVLGTLLRPVKASLDEALCYIKQFPEQLTELMDDWRQENAELLEQFGGEMKAEFAEVKDSLSIQTHTIDKIVKNLSRFEMKLDKHLAESASHIFKADVITAQDLRVLSEAQLAMASFSSRFDISFDLGLFEPRKEGDDAFLAYLEDINFSFSKQHYLFLILAGAGMGKTWISAYWVQQLSKQMLDFEEKDLFVPFFISLKSGLTMQLRGFFNASDNYTAKINLRKAKITSELIPILFFDGLDEIKPDEAKATLEFAKELVSEKIPVVLTCRDTDWAREENIIQMHSKLNNTCFEHEAGAHYPIKEVSCKPSLYLEKFTDEEFQNALGRYDISGKAFMSELLLEMGRHPVLLRLFSEYYKEYDTLPNPDKPSEFKTLFLGKQGDPPETNILGRLGIIGKKRDYLVLLTSRFLKKGDELKANELTDLIKEVEYFRTIRSAGLIREIWNPAYTAFKLNNLYKPHLEHMAILAGVEIETNIITPPGPVRDEKAPFRTKMVKKSEIEALKTLQKETNTPLKVDEFEVNEDGSVISLDLTSLILETIPKSIFSLHHLMEINFSGKSFTKDDVLRSMVFDGLVVNVDGEHYVEGQIEARIKRESEEKAKKEAEEKERQEKEKRLKNKNHDIISQAKERLEAKKWKEAIELFNQSKEICSEQDWPDGVTYTKEMIQKAEKNLRIEEKHKKEAGEKKRKEAEEKKIKEAEEKKIKEAEEKAQLSKVISFRSAQIPQFEANTLIEIEKLTDKQFKKLDKVKYNTKMGFATENQRITHIGLYECGLSTLPESISNLSSLEKLWLNDNQLTTLPESIGNPSSLETLYLGDNKLSTFPESITKLKSLQSLDLRSNQLTTLPESIGNLSSLERLSLESNKLSTLPESIGDLTLLQTLNLWDNRLTTLPESIGDLTSLTYLYLNDNKITTLPESISNLKSLEDLYLTGNPLVSKADSKSKAILKSLKRNGVDITK